MMVTDACKRRSASISCIRMQISLTLFKMVSFTLGQHWFRLAPNRRNGKILVTAGWCVKRTSMIFQLKQHFIHIRMCVCVWEGWGWLQIQDSISCWVLSCRTQQWSGLRYLPIYKKTYQESPVIHYNDVIMGDIASQITNLTLVFVNRLFRRR